MKAKQTAQNARYKTRRRSDNGPKEYQIASNALNRGREIVNSVEGVMDGINLVIGKSPEIKAKIGKLVSVSSGTEEGDENRLVAEILNDAKEIYKTNFEGGIDVDRFRTSHVALWTFLGLLAGGLAGGLVDLGGRYIWGSRRNYF